MVRSPGLAAAAHSGFADVVASLAAFAAVGETGDLVEVQAVMATDRPPIAMAERSFVMDVSLHSPEVIGSTTGARNAHVEVPGDWAHLLST